MFLRQRLLWAGALTGAVALTAALGVSPLAFGMGGEDVRHGRPWHHLDMTARALAGDAALDAPGGGRYPVRANVYPGVGFSRAAAMSIAWHADYIDSYLYNPVWWLEGGSSSPRFKTALTMFGDLSRMHHDDTFSMPGVRDNWERYTAGALIGLVTAADRGASGDVAAAHQILGIASHAAQDFYSHSNWMDAPDRRSRTWFDIPVSQRRSVSGLDVKTGAYEHPSQHAPFHHGAYSMSCTLLNADGLSSAISGLCGGLSPLQNTSLCISYRSCRSGAPVDMSISDIVVSDVVYLQPRGVALDTTWLARVGAETRGLSGRDGAYAPDKASPRRLGDMCSAVVNYGVSCEHSNAGDMCATGGPPRSCVTDTDHLFAETKDLATRTTMQYVNFLGQAMRDLEPASGDRYEVFWNRVMTEASPLSARIAQFEDFSRIPFQFMSAGPYPIGNPATSASPFIGSSGGWYLRVRIRTSGDSLSGTDADIRLKVDGGGWSQTHELDYLPTTDEGGRTSNRLLVYNDFEQGDNDVYTVGPFPGRPQSVTLINDDAGASEILSVFWEDFRSSMEAVATTLRQVAIGLIGGNADIVGSAQKHYDHAALVSQTAGRPSRDDFLDVNGGDEGRYRVHYTFRLVNQQLTPQQLAQGWLAAEFTLNRLEAVRESEWDRGSDSDEPFFFFSLAPLNGLSDARVAGYRAGPFDDVDSGESRSLGGQRTFTFRIPPYGGITLAMQHWESDDENSADRNALYETFLTGLEDGTRTRNRSLLDAAGAAIAADWKVEEIEILPFLRGPRPELAPLFTRASVGWIEGGERRTFALPSGPSRSLLPLPRPDLNSWSLMSDIALPSLQIRPVVPRDLPVLPMRPPGGAKPN